MSATLDEAGSLGSDGSGGQAGRIDPGGDRDPAGAVGRPRSRRRPGIAAVAGGIGLVVVVAAAVLGPFLAPHDPDATMAKPYAGAGDGLWLGADFLGRDVWSRVLHGGHTVLLYAFLATAAAYVIGLALGMLAGFLRGWVDQVLMRVVDVLMAFPTIVFLLLLASAVGRGIYPIVLATAVIQATAIARVIRTATLEQSVRGFVEAAIARGESTWVILVREILPNLSGTLAADIGLRFTWSALLIASVNFLGLGLQPPASDWGLMISENRGGIDLNPLAVLGPAAVLGLLTVSITLLTDGLEGEDR